MQSVAVLARQPRWSFPWASGPTATNAEKGFLATTAMSSKLERILIHFYCGVSYPILWCEVIGLWNWQRSVYEKLRWAMTDEARRLMDHRSAF